MMGLSTAGTPEGYSHGVYSSKSIVLVYQVGKAQGAFLIGGGVVSSRRFFYQMLGVWVALRLSWGRTTT